MFVLGMYTESMSIDVVVWYSDFRIWNGGGETMRYFMERENEIS